VGVYCQGGAFTPSTGIQVGFLVVRKK
jgi:hypothetical protein